jgi:glycosyltransferase involved in cell wall biosynthesis
MLFNKKAVTLIANSVHNTSRLFKISKFLTEKGRIGQLTVIGFWDKGLALEEDYSPKVRIERRKSLKQKLPDTRIVLLSKFLTALSIVPFFTGIFFSCLRKKPEVIYCHDVVMLPIALFVKLFNKATIIYMPHELETEETGLGKVTSLFLKIFEKTGMKFIKHTTVVSPGIQHWYKNKYKTDKVSSIRNIPDFDNQKQSINKKLRLKLGLSDTEIVFIYQGLIENSRGVLEVATIFSELNDTRKHLVFMGYGPSTKTIVDFTTKFKNIHYTPAVEPKDIFDYTSDADVGIFFIPKEISLSYKYSLPNKYFEYVKSGIPILISDNLISIEEEMNANHTGWCIRSSKEALQQFIESINSNDILEAKRKVVLANVNYNWDKEVSILLDI